MDWKKRGKTLLFPHIAIMTLLVPISTAFLVFSMVTLGTESPIAIVSYVLSAYTLTVWCFRIPRLIRFFKNFKQENKHLRRWLEDARLRVNVSLYASLLGNVAYGIFQLWLGFYHHTLWFYSLGAYYICLAVMRFFLLQHTVRHKPGEKMRQELSKFRACGWIFLLMNLALALMIFFMVYWNRTVVHHEITTIAMAAYTFTAFTAAIVSIIKYRKYNSPVYSASKTISLAAACVSMLTLESTMLTIWGEAESPAFRQLMLALTGGAIVIFIVVMAIYMITAGNRGIRALQDSRAHKNYQQENSNGTEE